MQKQSNPNRFAAIDLRKDGLAIDEISSRLNISRGAVYHWVREVELTAEQKAALIANRGNVAGFARSKAVAANKNKYATIRNAARKQGFNEADGSPIHVAGCMLYWAEGDKAVNQVVLSNTDPIMLRKFTEFLRSMGASDEKIIVSCQVHSTPLNGNKEQCQQFWSSALDVEKEKVKVYFPFDPRGASSRKSRYPHGVGRVSVYDTALVQRIYGGIEAYAGCDLPMGRKLETSWTHHFLHRAPGSRGRRGWAAEEAQAWPGVCRRASPICTAGYRKGASNTNILRQAPACEEGSWLRQMTA